MNGKKSMLDMYVYIQIYRYRYRYIIANNYKAFQLACSSLLYFINTKHNDFISFEGVVKIF